MKPSLISGSVHLESALIIEKKEAYILISLLPLEATVISAVVYNLRTKGAVWNQKVVLWAVTSEE